MCFTSSTIPEQSLLCHMAFIPKNTYMHYLYLHIFSSEDDSQDICMSAVEILSGVYKCYKMYIE